MFVPLPKEADEGASELCWALLQNVGVMWIVMAVDGCALSDMIVQFGQENRRKILQSRAPAGMLSGYC